MSTNEPQTTPIGIRTLLQENGEAKVVFTLPDNVTLLLDPDAGVEMALNLLSACYAARGERALWLYTQDHKIDIKDVIRIERHGN